MKRALIVLVALGVMAVGGAAQADHWHHRHHSHHHGHYHGHYHHSPAVTYYRAPVVYHRYCQPAYYPGNTFYYRGSNFGFGFGW